MMGLGFSLPNIWAFAKQNIDKNMSKSMAKEEKLSSGSPMRAVDPDGCSVEFSYRKLDENEILYETTKEYAEGSVKQIGAGAVVKEIQIGPEKYYGYVVVKAEGNKTTYIINVLKKVEDYILCYRISGTDKEKVESLVLNLYTLNN